MSWNETFVSVGKVLDIMVPIIFINKLVATSRDSHLLC